MPNNPLEDDAGFDQRVRERAYHMWEAEGKTHGQDQEYWERARELEAMATSQEAGQIANPIAAGIDPTAVQAEDATIQENLGEFPDRLSDQGDHPQTPSIKNLKL